MARPWWRTAALAGCGAALGAGIVTCGVVGGVGGIGAAVAAAKWESAARQLLASQTGGEVTFDDLRISVGSVTVVGLAVHDGAGELLRVDELVLGVGPSALTRDPVRIDTVEASGVHVTARCADRAGTSAFCGGAGFAVPPTLEALARSGSTSFDWPEVAVEAVTLRDVAVTAVTPDGTVDATVDQAEVHGLHASLDGGLAWTFASAEATGADALRDGRGLRADRVLLGADGALDVTGARAAFHVQDDRTLDLLPVLADVAPRWLGGHRAVPPDQAPWLGLSFAGLPWQPAVLRLDDAVLELTDGTFVSPPVPWRIAASHAELGPLPEGTVPLVATVGWAGGTGQAHGTVEPDGAIALTLDHAGSDATFYAPYLRPVLHRLGLTIGRGRVAADLDVRLRGSRVDVDGLVVGTEMVFAADQRDDAGSALAGFGGRLLAEGQDTWRTPVSIHGDLQDPRFSPTRELIAGVEDTLTAGARGVVDKAVGGVKRTVRKIFGKGD
ncbi:MAG: hypothetical protein R3F59_01660 [Myxococcota bacterium]